METVNGNVEKNFICQYPLENTPWVFYYLATKVYSTIFRGQKTDGLAQCLSISFILTHIKDLLRSSIVLFIQTSKLTCWQSMLIDSSFNGDIQQSPGPCALRSLHTPGKGSWPLQGHTPDEAPAWTPVEAPADTVCPPSVDTEGHWSILHSQARPPSCHNSDLPW